MIEAHEFEIARVWDVNGCNPPCCPHTLLFGTIDGLFVYVETWQELDRQNYDRAQSKLRIESTPVGKYNFKIALNRETIRYSEALREFNEFFEISGPVEWKVFKREELPKEVITILESA